METWTSRIRWTIRRFQTDLARHGRAVALREDLAVRSIVVASTLLVGGSLAGLACDEGDDLFLHPSGEEIVVAFEDGPSRFPTADWSLREVELEGDDLVLEIEHAGGCAEHRYWILAGEGFITLPAGSPIETGPSPSGWPTTTEAISAKLSWSEPSVGAWLPSGTRTGSSTPTARRESSSGSRRAGERPSSAP